MPHQSAKDIARDAIARSKGKAGAIVWIWKHKCTQSGVDPDEVCDILEDLGDADVVDESDQNQGYTGKDEDGEVWTVIVGEHDPAFPAP